MMQMNLIQKVAGELNVKPSQVHNTIQLLLEEECTIPFVARYRKEVTGSLDEVQLRDIRDRYAYLTELESSKAKYLKVVEEHCQKNPALAGKYEELARKFQSCATRQELEDLYLPFKPKRRTRAMVAREKGLEPLLDKILDSRETLNDLAVVAAAYVTPDDSPVTPELRVADASAALAGAADILAERINETAEHRALVRVLSLETGALVAKKIEDKPAPAVQEPVTAADVDAAAAGRAKAAARSRGGGKKADAAKYENYFDYKEPLKAAPSHRIMAVRRGEAEKFLRVAIEVDDERIVHDLKASVLGPRVATDAVKAWLSATVEDAFKRLMGPSIETELRLMLKTQAEDEAINVFSKNLENLLLLPPIPHKVVMGVDPGIRTGSKLAVVDETGKLLASATIYPDYRKEESAKTKEAKSVVAGFVDKFKVQCIACGNGTGSREIDRFITLALKEFNISGVKRVVVNEAGASVYSTDDIAREEFPDLDPTIRSTVSIARRLQDPLAELVKISPRSIGVGQYQHDVNPNKLGRSLEEVVESCVNKVGVNLNTASYKLLGYVSGVGPTLAKSIVSYRDEHGRFGSREELLKVLGLGPKAYQQAAGFIRVPDSANPLDNSGVHPERYEIIEMIAKDLRKDMREIVGHKDVVETIPWERYVNQTLGMPTLQDIAAELIKPGRDPREDGARLMFSDEVSELTDLRPGMTLKGTVTNVTNFGAFVDIGVHQDGLVHISELSDTFVKDASEAVAVGAVLSVRILDIDLARRRISLSCKTPAAERPPQAQGGQRQGQDVGQRGGGGQRPGGGGSQNGGGGQRQGNGGQHQGGSQGGQRHGGGQGGGGQGGGGQGGQRHGGGQGGGGNQNGGGQGGGQRQGGGNRQPSQPDKHFTVNDLLSKFNKK